MRAGLLVNPRSGGGSGKGLALAQKLASSSVPAKILGHFDELPQCLAEFANGGVTDLFISSGDGTIHAVQTELAENKLFAALPRLALLPHGTTNMTAADLGFRRRGIDEQAEFIRNPLPTDFSERPTLRAVNPGDGRPRHGMFLGTGALSEAALLCQRTFNARGVKGNWATFATLASAVSRSLFSPSDPLDQTRFDRPFAIAVEVDGQPVATGEHLLMLATTLNKLILGAKPFWGGKKAAIRATILPYPVPALPRWLLPILYGGETVQAPPGAISFSAGELAVRTPASFVLDGEFFHSAPDEALRIETGPVFTYVRG
ncbi:MAG: diacylglycerol/lipid kinase family protein [Methylocella sp.]